jgi:hypothetical protein
MRIVHQKAFQRLKIGLTGIGISIIQKKARTTGRETMNPIWNGTMAVRIPNLRSSGTSVPYRMFPD